MLGNPHWTGFWDSELSDSFQYNIMILKSVIFYHVYILSYLEDKCIYIFNKILYTLYAPNPIVQQVRG